MELETTPRSTTATDDRLRSPRLTRREVLENFRGHHETSHSMDQGPGPATIEITPPRYMTRSKPRFTPHVTGRNHQEKADCLTAEQTIELFTKKIEEARSEARNIFSGSESVSSAIKPTLTIDLGRARIERLPDAIVDLIIVDVERLSLSHNLLRYIPVRITDCSQLRYLNIRSNDFKEIPPSLYSMPLLEILDVSKNKITSISPEIKRLESLRVFSIVFNRLTDLPIELAELPRLKVLKVGENPFRKSIKRVIQQKETEVAYAEMLENERDTAMTAEILRHLRGLRLSSANALPVDGGEVNEPNSAIEPPRLNRRASSGRFPVVPASLPTETGENGEPGSHNNKPSLPAKSHLRGLSGQSASGIMQKRPGIAPVVSGNERNRSNSESVIQASAAARQKRMGMLRRDRTELDSIDETSVVRQSHLRGRSFGSMLRKNGSISSPGAASSSPNSPKDFRKDRSQFVRRLSSLPEHKTDQSRRPLIEGAKGILYALYQVHPHISGLINASKGRDARRSGLEMSFYNASTHVDKLNKSLEYVENIDAEDDEAWDRVEDAINSDCAICIKSFKHVIQQMQETTHKIVVGADPRYVRSLMLLLYGSILEIRNAIQSFGVEVKHHRRQMSSGATHPIATIPEETTPETPGSLRHSVRDLDSLTTRPSARTRSDTVLKHPSQNVPNLQPVQPPILQIPISNGVYSRPPSALSNASHKSFAARSRSNSRSITFTLGNDGPGSAVANTPRSTDGHQLPSVMPTNNRTNADTGLTDTEEEQRFELIFLALTKAYETALSALPLAMQQLQRCQESAVEQRQPKDILDLWNALVAKSRTCLDVTHGLQLRLTNMKLKDSGVGLSSAEGGRHDPQFWVLCKSFLSSFVVLVKEMKQVRGSRMLILPQEVVAVLRPVQKSCQEAGHIINTSPWAYMLQGVTAMPAPTPLARAGEANRSQYFPRQTGQASGNVSAYSAALIQQQNNQAFQGRLQPLSLNSLPTPSLPTPSSTGSATPISTTSPLPATPLSAALGPAAQATVPSTPASLYSDSFFKGDVFQRADSLLSMTQAAGVNFLNRR